MKKRVLAVAQRRIRIRRLSVYLEPRDVWVGVYIAPNAVYVCPAPLIVFKFDREARA